MRAVLLIGAVVLGFCLAPRRADAQLAEVVAGAKVRVRSPELGTRVTGTVLERHGDTLRIARRSGQPFDIAISQITALELSSGRSRSYGARTGALWTAAVFAPFGLLIGETVETCYVDAAPTTNPSGCRSADGMNFAERVAITAVFAVTGALYGAGFGALIGRERWDAAALPTARVRATVRTMPDGRWGGGVRFAW